MALTGSLVSYWKFDEASGNAADAHGSNTLTNNNSATYAAAKINNGGDTSGGTTRYFSITDASQTGLEPSSGSFSFQVWVKINSNPGANQAQTYFAKFGGAGQRSYSLNHDTYTYSGRSNHLTFSVYDVDDTFTTVEGAFTPTNGAWHHFVAVADATNDLMTVYLNGTSTLSVAWTGNGVRGTTVDVQIGGSGNQDWIDGIVDESAFWSRALTSTEVTELYNGGAGLSYDDFGGGVAPQIPTLLMVGVG